MEKYRKFTPREKMDFNIRFGTITFGVICITVVALGILSEVELRSVRLVGSTSLGNVALGITIGQFAADIFYCVAICSCKMKWTDYIHHGATILGAFLAHRYFHTFALYRYIHELTLPLIGTYAQMNMLRFDTKRRVYKLVCTANVILFTLLRFVVIPFHWFWMIWASLNAPDKMEIPWYVWVITVSGHILVDYVNIGWAVKVMKKFKKLRENDWSPNPNST